MSGPIFDLLPQDLRITLRVIVQLGRGINVHPFQVERELAWDPCRIAASLAMLEELGLISRVAGTVVPTARGQALVRHVPTGGWVDGTERRRRPRTRA
jgi:hypothetical protein